MLDKTLVAGTLNARIADLAVWSGLAGTRLAGAAEARATLAAKDGQRADIDASVRDLRLDDAGASVSRIKVEARLADLFGTPSGKATVDASAVASPDMRADTVRVAAQSSKPGQFAVTADAQGALAPRPEAEPVPPVGGERDRHRRPRAAPAHHAADRPRRQSRHRQPIAADRRGRPGQSAF